MSTIYYVSTYKPQKLVYMNLKVKLITYSLVL